MIKNKSGFELGLLDEKGIQDIISKMSSYDLLTQNCGNPEGKDQEFMEHLEMNYFKQGTEKNGEFEVFILPLKKMGGLSCWWAIHATEANLENYRKGFFEIFGTLPEPITEKQHHDWQDRVKKALHSLLVDGVEPPGEKVSYLGGK
jgi:hypothetical protein